ncbi:hypothetical protein PF010_g26797 [Phytophthora fragariae]|uniref:PiggyBac transposable element-derived protein domain-containing protein n=1 Tax=Phytophthora fragariae TaxID=53985 RepID=A0A6G0MMP8_9STRA|nr:hypothetical protein PF010_g26797 [Phytophthora fragariae]KAE9174024.1 hypothetical protein PF004_g26781 [Phytophthora fragariae]
MRATGCSTQLSSVERTEKAGTRSTAPCSQLVVDYNLGMGGVDVHDQLRLHRYSIQKTISLRKYYKQLFLCIVDMAIVNGYIVHRIKRKQTKKTPPTHADYLRRLHNQVLALRTINFETHMNAEDFVSVPIPHQEHTLVNTDEFYSKGKHHKYRLPVQTLRNFHLHDTPWHVYSDPCTNGGL